MRYAYEIISDKPISTSAKAAVARAFKREFRFTNFFWSGNSFGFEYSEEPTSEFDRRIIRLARQDLGNAVGIRRAEPQTRR